MLSPARIPERTLCASVGAAPGCAPCSVAAPHPQLWRPLVTIHGLFDQLVVVLWRRTTPHDHPQPTGYVRHDPTTGRTWLLDPHRLPQANAFILIGHPSTPEQAPRGLVLRPDEAPWEQGLAENHKRTLATGSRQCRAVRTTEGYRLAPEGTIGIFRRSAVWATSLAKGWEGLPAAPVSSAAAR